MQVSLFYFPTSLVVLPRLQHAVNNSVFLQGQLFFCEHLLLPAETVTKTSFSFAAEVAAVVVVDVVLCHFVNHYFVIFIGYRAAVFFCFFVINGVVVRP